MQGVIASLGSLAAVTAPVFMTPMFRAFSDPEAPIFLPGAPFLVAALLMAATLPLVIAMSRRRAGASTPA